MPLVVLTGPIIAAGQSLSDAIDVNGDMVRITMPAGWTPANLTFQISTDGEGYNDLFNPLGQEIMLPVVPGTAVIVPVEMTRAIRFIKFRSGRRDFPVVQEEQRDFAVAVQQAAPPQARRSVK